MRSRIYMTAVDTGWINDEKPLPQAQQHFQVRIREKGEPCSHFFSRFAFVCCCFFRIWYSNSARHIFLAFHRHCPVCYSDFRTTRVTLFPLSFFLGRAFFAEAQFSDADRRAGRRVARARPDHCAAARAAERRDRRRAAVGSLSERLPKVRVVKVREAAMPFTNFTNGVT